MRRFIRSLPATLALVVGLLCGPIVTSAHAQDDLLINAAAMAFSLQYLGADADGRDELAQGLIELSNSGPAGEQAAFELTKALGQLAGNSTEIKAVCEDLYARCKTVRNSQRQTLPPEEDDSDMPDPTMPELRFTESPEVPRVEQRPSPEAATGKALYDRVVRASVAIVTPSGMGSGTVIHLAGRLVLTNYHVVGTNDVVGAYVAEFDGDRVIGDVAHYLGRRPIRGKVVAKDATRDIAVVQLDSLPDGVVDLPLAKHSATPGEDVFLVGNGGAVDAWFAFLNGSVRAVNRQTLDYPTGQQVRAVVATTSMPTNPGDSGAAVVNAQGEIVAVNMCYSTDARLVSRGTDVCEIRKFLGIDD